MKIIWLAHESNMSGANMCLLEYLSVLKDRGIQNYLVIPFGTGNLHEKATQLNIPVKRIKFYSWAHPVQRPKEKYIGRIRKKIRNYFAVKQMSSLIKDWQPDYVATNTITMVVGALAANKNNTKHIWFVHEFGEEDHGFSIAANFKKGAMLMNLLSNKIVFNSVAVKDKYLDIVPNQKCFIVDNAVLISDVVVNEKENTGNFKLLLLGQLAPSKNHEEAILAIDICKQCGVDCSLEIIGKAENIDYKDSLVELVANKKLTDSIHFLGPVEHPENLFSQYHALLMCSHNEAFGRVTVEALKCGLPVIAANTGGSLGIIKDGINGYFYKAGDPSSLAEKIMQLKQHYNQFDKQGIAFNTKNRYNEKNTGDQLMKVFSTTNV
ncbi:glycosyltransferase [soil metagenome]